MKTMRSATRATPENTPLLALTAVPDHVAIIMDGNGRWAKERGRPRLFGHRAGTENVRRVIERFGDYGVKYLTLFAFSTENWDRPRYEVRGLMSLLSRFLKRETKHLHENGIRLLHLRQGAYAEFCFPPVCRPDFDIKHVDEALLAFSLRTRRFGGLPLHEVDGPAGNGHQNGRNPAERPAASNGFRA